MKFLLLHTFIVFKKIICISAITNNGRFSVFYTKKNKGMNIFSFTAEFSSEQACHMHFKEARDKIWCCLQKLFTYRALLDKEPMELRMQKMQEQDFPAQRHDHAEFKPVLFDLVQDHVFAYSYQKGLFFQRDTAPVGIKTLRACLGDGP